MHARTHAHEQDPIALAYDARATNKSLYITDDPNGKGDQSQGLYRLPCRQFACVTLTSYVHAWTCMREWTCVRACVRACVCSFCFFVCLWVCLLVCAEVCGRAQ